MNDYRKNDRLRSIEALVLKILQSDHPTIELRGWADLKNLQFTDRVTMRSQEDAGIRYIRFSHQRSRSLFTSVIHLLNKIYVMLKTNSWCTKREIYYQEIDIMSSQQLVDSTLQIICYLLNCPPWELNIMSSTKGLVAGPLLMKTYDDDIIDCTSPGGTLIPHLISSRTTELKTTAQLVLIVEKDATFQKLLSDKILHEFEKLILVTGKGYPDIYTRILIKKLNEDLQLPVLALLDADPDGISIMCVYRFGSARMSKFAQNLATPDIKWLGIHPSDLSSYSILSLPFDDGDENKLRTLSKKEFVMTNEQLLREVNILLHLRRKAEIEAVYKTSPNFSIQEYIRDKIIKNELY